MRRVDAALLTANWLGVGSYLYCSSRIWLPSDERGHGLPVSGGDAIVWALTALPVLVVFALIDLGWLISLGFHRRHRKQPALFLALSVAAWVAALLLDRHMSS